MGRKLSSFARLDSRGRLPYMVTLGFLRFALQGALQRLVKRCFGLLVLLLADLSLFVFDFQFEEFVFQAFEQHGTSSYGCR